MPSLPHVAVLLYHHVGPVRDENCRGLTVTPEAFSRQIKTISALGWTVITPNDWVAYVRNECDLPARSLIITFDDAYSDLVVHALPILEEHGFPSTVFVPTSLVGKRNSCSSRNPDASMPVMSIPQIREWCERGVTFGAHSRTHADLTTLDVNRLDDEVLGSRDELASMTGKTVTSFAYPYGRLNAEVQELVTRAFSIAFTAEEGLSNAGTPLTAVRRTMVQHADSVVDICLRIRFGRSALQSIRTAAYNAVRPAPARS
jgi:peptidoglycan/xylan/chitin deacetylase (PgdA/CDA1 family)